MSKKVFFAKPGENEPSGPHHFRECGLDWVWLLNGFSRTIESAKPPR